LRDLRGAGDYASVSIWKRLTLGRKIALTSSCLILTGVVIAASALWATQKFSAALNGATNVIPGLQKLASLQALGLEYRGTSLLMGTPGLAQGYKTKQLDHLQELETGMLHLLDAYVEEAPAEEQPLLAETKRQTVRFLEICKHFRELAAGGQYEQAGNFWSDQGGVQSKLFRKVIQQEVDFKNRGASRTVAAGTQSAAFTRVSTYFLAIAAVLIGFLLGWLLVRDINGSLRRITISVRAIAEQVASASGQMATASRRLADAANSQAASLQETSASGHQVSAMTMRNSEHSRAAADLMRDLGASVTTANQKLKLLVESMGDIRQSSEGIGRIISVIEQIASQTNILALNAAVEAARSGVAGMGFAVVADEVRSLAERCSHAARDTTQLIEQSVVHARSGSSRLEEVNLVIRQVTTAADSVQKLIAEVEVSAAEQSKGIDQISDALIVMERSTNDTAGTAEQSASASEELRAQSESMYDVVLQLEQMVG
jgi:methyl-accepting chemotaxis protein/methyl-accepting chemotaxis protein-1 (serine sensor receptor)